MPFMPFAVIPLLITGLLSLVFLFGGGYVVYEWYAGAAISTTLLACAIAALVISVIGRFIVLLAHGGGSDDPNWSHSTETETLARPDGTVLHLEFYGAPDAPPAVLVHGWGLDNRGWFYTKRFLAVDHRVIVYDLRGLGKSSKAGGHDYSLDAMADDLAAVVERAGGRVFLCGHSIGGMIIQTFARRHALLYDVCVVSAALLNTTYTDPVATTFGFPVLRPLQGPLFTPLMYLTIGLAPLIWAMNWLSYINGTLLITTALSGFTGSESRGLLDFAARFMVKANPAVLARGMLAMFRFDESRSIARMHGPTLLVPGANDPVLLPEASERMRRVMPKASLATLTPGRHMSCIEHHTAFHAELQSFITMHALNKPARTMKAAAK